MGWRGELLVYVSAFAPDVGQSLAMLAKSGPPTEGAAAIHPDDKGNLYIDPKVFPAAVAADLPPQIAESLANSQLPLNHVAFEAPVDTAAWRDKPTFYVISTNDKVIAPEAQKFFATRMHAQTTEVAGSHASLVGHAQEVAAQSSFYSVNDRLLHFGLGVAASADLTVRWPGGAVEQVSGVAADQLVVIREGAGILRREKFGNPSPLR